MQRFDKFNSDGNGTTDPQEPIPTVENGGKPSNGDTSDASNHKRSPDSESALSSLEDAAPPKKKAKKSRPKDEDDDAAYARKLQMEENSRGRSTRGGNTKKRAPPPKKKAKKKSANRVKDEDDSDIASGSGAEKKSPSKKGGFHVRLSLHICPLPPTQFLLPSPNYISQHLNPLLTTIFAETNGPLPRALHPPRRNHALAAPNREKDLAIRQGARPAGSSG